MNSCWCSPFRIACAAFDSCCNAPRQWCGALNGSAHGMSVVFRGTMHLSVHMSVAGKACVSISPVGLICAKGSSNYEIVVPEFAFKINK